MRQCLLFIIFPHLLQDAIHEAAMVPVDPCYLVYKAQEPGYYPQVILAGRPINDYMPEHVAMFTIRALTRRGR